MRTKKRNNKMMHNNLEVSSDYVEALPTGDGNGIHLQLTFEMKPSTPPGMSETMTAYFTCDEF